MPLVIKTADFPAAALDGTANAILNGGGNLRAYTDSSKATRLPLDIVTLVSSGSPDALVHARIDTAESAATIYFETHESETTQPAVGAAFGRNAVWADYEAVLHLSETGDGTAGEYIDSSGNGHDGQLTSGTSPPAAITTNHPFGGTWSGFGNSHAITLANTAAMITGGDFNFSIFYNVTLLNNAKGLFGNRFGSSSDYAQMKLNGQVRVNGAGDVTVGGTQATADVTNKMQADVGAGGIEYFQNGASKNTGSGQTLTTDDDFRIGTYYDASSERFINGNACEARIRKSKLGATWVAVEYANQIGNGDWATSSAWAETTPDTTKTASIAIQAQTATIAMTVEYTPPEVNNTVVELFCVGTGTSTPYLIDANNADNNLLINYQTDKAVFVNDASGTGLDFTAGAATSNAAYAMLSNAKDNGDIATKLNGVKKMWILLVLDLTAGHANGSRIFHFGEDSGNGIMGLTVTTSKLEMRWDNAATGNGSDFPLPPVGKTIVAINIDTNQASLGDRVKTYYDKVEQTNTTSDISQFSALSEMTSATGDFVVGNRGSANRGIQGVIRYLKIVKDENLTAQEIIDSYDGLSANDDIDWQDQEPPFVAPAQVDYIMTSIFNRAAYSSSSTATPFTVALKAGATAPPTSSWGYFTIEQNDDNAIFANVVGELTTATNFVVHGIEQTSESDDSMPVFAGALNIFSSLPVKRISEAEEDGRDIVLMIGDGNCVGNNGTASSTNGWNEILDRPSASVLTLNLGTLAVNDAHSGTVTDNELTNQYHIAEEPLPHTQNAGGFPPANSVGFGIPLAKQYFHRTQWARQALVLPLGKTADSSFTGTQWIASTGSLYLAAVSAVDTALAANAESRVSMIVISLGHLDASGAASAAFEAALDALINKLRSDAFAGNAMQTDFSKVPVVVCGLHADFITTIGAEATAINNSLADTPNRLRNTAFAAIDASYTTDASTWYWDATAMRDMGKVIYTAYTNTFTNIVI